MADVGLLHSGQTRIPVRNLWLLMLYASELFATDDRVQAAGVEDAGDDLPDLVAEVLVSAVEHRLHRPLSRRHVPHRADLTRVRGRIDHLRTQTRGLLTRGQVACRFDDLSVDHLVNRVVYTGLALAARVARSSALRERAGAAARLLAWSGVSTVPISPVEAAAVQLGRNDGAEQRMVSAAILLLQMSVFTEDSGTLRAQSAERDIVRWRRLYEAAVRGFYSAVLRDPWAGERKQATHRWPLQEATAGMASLMPTMETDVVLRGPARRVLVETKFTAPTQIHSQYGGITFKRDHLFQLHAYLTTLPRAEGERLDGVLLYPQVDDPIDEHARIGDHRLRVMTVDLSASGREIRERLLSVPFA